jgi:hypothetical protein
MIHRMDQAYRWSTGRLQTPRGLLHALDSELLADKPVFKQVRALRERFFPTPAVRLEAEVEFTHAIIHPAPIAGSGGAEDADVPAEPIIPASRLRKGKQP